MLSPSYHTDWTRVKVSIERVGLPITYDLLLEFVLDKTSRANPVPLWGFGAEKQRISFQLAVGARIKLLMYEQRNT